MAKKVKKEKPKKGFNIFDEDESAVASSEEELPKDEAGRRKITQYTRYGTVFLALFQGIGIAVAVES